VAESFGRSVEAWLDCFAEPLVIATPESTLVLEGDAARTMGEQIRSQLRDRGLDRTEVRSLEIVMIGEDIAFADGSFDRLRSDGSVLEVFQAGYLCRKRNGRWLVVTLAPRGVATAQPADE
jgi:hypothetical protein